MINMIEDAVAKYSDTELIDHLSVVMGGIAKNYRLALQKGDSNILLANLGDIVMVASILRSMKRRNEERVARQSAK